MCGSRIGYQEFGPKGPITYKVLIKTFDNFYLINGASYRREEIISFFFLVV
jgi:hypothetical protein